jgi:flagellar hook-length control protein FliK
VDVIPAETPVSLAGAIPALPETTTPKDTPPPANTAVASAGVESVSGSSMTGLSGVVSGGAGLAETVSAEIRQPLTAQISRAVYEYVQRQGAGGNENTSMTLRLDPPTLGELVISLSQTAEGIAVRVTAREPVTMDMLLARGQEIESQLKSQDLNLAGVEFLNADQFSGSSHQQNSSGRDRFASAEEAAAGVRNRAGRVTSGKSSGRGEQTGEPPASGSRLSFRA